MTLKVQLSDQVRVINVVLNQDTLPLALDLYYSFQSYQIHLSGQSSVIYTILILATPLTGLKPL